MNNLHSLNKQDFPASFRVIGVGVGIEDIINKIKALELNGVSAEIAEPPFDCIPKDEDKLAIIVFTDLEENANRIANTFHDAGVLTIGFSEDADPSCYDSIMHCASNESPEIIKTLLLPILTPGYICYDFYDFCLTLRDSKYFTIKSTSGNDVQEAIETMHGVFNELDLSCVDYLSIHLYFNPSRSKPIAMSDMKSLLELMALLHESVNVMWSVNQDEKLTGDEIRLSAILAGKEVWKCSIK